MKTVEANKDEFLFPLRKKRDELCEELLEEYPAHRAALDQALIGNLDPMLLHGPACDCDDEDCDEDHSWESDLHHDFYTVCLKIKKLEAKLYDQAMKGK